MIKKGLKIGDTFTDGGFLYKITAIHECGYYVSSRVGSAREEAKATKAEAKETPSLDDIPYSDLKKMAKEQGISAKGSKEEVLERLRGI